MQPTIFPKNRVLAWGGFYAFKKPRLDDVIVFKIKDKYFVKRVKKIHKNGSLFVKGDNDEDTISMDLKSDEVLGKVFFKY